MLYSFFSRPVSAWLPSGGRGPGLGCQMLKFRVKGQLGSDLCIITQILSALLTTPPPSCNRRVLIKCPFLSQNSNFHTILLTKLIPYSDHKKSVRNWCFFPVFNCLLTHFAKFERCWTMKSSKRLLYLLRINKQLFVVNHVFSIKTMFPHNLVKKSAQPSSQNPNYDDLYLINIFNDTNLKPFIII